MIMADSNRRDFLRRASFGAVAVGAVAAAPELLLSGTAAAAAPAAAAPPLAALPVDGHIAVLLRDPGKGEFALMVGEWTTMFTDKALAARLTHEAQ